MDPHNSPHHRYPPSPDAAGRGGAPFHTRLDATGSREVVYCHACAAEWHRDEHGIICPACESEATEIISPENDPRDDGQDEDNWNEMPGLFSEDNPFVAGGHPEADEDDDASGPQGHIHFHVRPGGGFFYNRTIWDGTQPQGRNRSPEAQAPDPGGDDVLRQFYDLINNITGPHFGHLNPPGWGARDGGGPSGEGARAGPRTTTTTTTTFTRFGPMGATRTEIRGPVYDGDVGEDDAAGAFPAYAPALVGTFISGVGPPTMTGATGRPPGHHGGIAATLTDILSMFLHSPGRHGDAVYSQEALDRIITQMMEANPQSNAAPPASEAALRRLPVKAVDDTMLQAEGGSAECTICIDALRIGDTIMTLPCKHWFHQTCATMWLKEHNTCPICRSPIESRNDDSEPRASGGGATSQGGGEGQRGHSSPDPGPSRSTDEGRSGRSGAAMFGGNTWTFHAHIPGGPSTAASASPAPERRHRVPTDNFPPSSASTPNPEGHRSPRLARADTGGSERSRRYSAYAAIERSTSFRSSRRDSRSPTSPDPNRSTRRRSPHESASSSRDRAEAGSSSHNPLSWLRHAMDRSSGGGSGSGSPSNRDGSGRRYY